MTDVGTSRVHMGGRSRCYDWDEALLLAVYAYGRGPKGPAYPLDRRQTYERTRRISWAEETPQGKGPCPKESPSVSPISVCVSGSRSWYLVLA